MVSLQISSMLQARMLQKYYLSPRLQHRPWISNAFGSVTCKFSKSCGPVRYAPRSTKQPKTPSTREQHNVEETDKHGPFMPESIHLNCDLTKQNRKTGAKSGLSLHAENDLSIASAKSPPHVFESRANGARDTKRSCANSSEVFEAYTRMQDMPMNSSEHFKIDRKYAAKWRDNVPRYSHESPASLFTKTQQTFGIEAINNAGSTSIFENGLDSAIEKAQMKEKNLFASMESDVERKSYPQDVKSIPSLPILAKHPVSREPDFQAGQQLPCKDIENFLLKIQNAKRRGWETLNKSQAAATAEGSLCIYDNNIFRDDSNDDRCLFLGQESFDEKDDGAILNFKDSVSKSTAAQEHAKNLAIRYLAMRPYTVAQLKKKLESQNITSELVDYALTTVQKCGLQSDLAYAETFSRARFNHGSWGPQRIKLGLEQRGISDEIIQAAIASVFCEEENDSEQYGRVENDAKSNLAKISKAAMDHLLVQATKQWNRGRNATNETKIRRMVSWLKYRGFNYNVIKIVLNHLQQGIPAEDE